MNVDQIVATIVIIASLAGLFFYLANRHDFR